MKHKSMLVLGMVAVLWSGVGESASAATPSPVPCQFEKEVRALSPELQQGAMVCLDSVRGSGGLTTLFLRDESERSEVWVVKSRVQWGRPVKNRIEAMIRGSGLFPQGCGEYLMGARVLPGSDRVALLYAEEVVRVADYQGRVVNALDPRDPNTVYTCEGYTPNKNARRGEVRVDARKRELWATVLDFKNPVVSDCKLMTPDQVEYLKEELSSLKESVSRMRDRLAHAADEEERKRYQDSVTLLEEEVSKIEKTLASGQSCRTSGRPVPHRLGY